VAKQRKVIWTPEARTDLDEIIAHIAKDSPTAARAFLEEVLNTAESLMTLFRARSHSA
jgi:plasmid stabilization system protein ParE